MTFENELKIAKAIGTTRASIKILEIRDEDINSVVINGLKEAVKELREVQNDTIHE